MFLDQPLALAQRQPKHGPERQGREDGELRIPGLAASGGARLGGPGRDCFVGEPDRQAAALPQAGVVLAPVRDRVLLAWNVVSAGLVQLERQGGRPRSDKGSPPTPPSSSAPTRPTSRSVQHSSSPITQMGACCWL